MTYAPSDLLAVRTWLLSRFDINKGLTRAADLDPAEVGVVGDDAHASTGGYHIGNDGLSRVSRLTSDYSKRESSRDRPGTNAASALDIGDFSAAGHTLRSLSTAIVAACQRGDSRTRDLREVIYSPDGSTVKRWDRLGIRTTGGSDHRWHTHLSFHRDSEGRRDRDDNFLGLLKAIVDRTESTTVGADMPLTTQDLIAVWTHDLVDGPGTGPAYKLINQIVADVAAIKAKPAVDVSALAADPTFVAALADAIAARVNLGGGATPAQVEEIVGRVVDRELDEQSRGGADTDA